MDIATLIGLLGAIGIVIAAMLQGGPIITFINVPSILIVVGGTVMVVMVKFSLAQFLGAFKVALRAFMCKIESPQKVIRQIVDLATIARKDGVLALENEDIQIEYLDEGVKMLIDGADRNVISTFMNKELQQSYDRHSWGERIWTATADVAPAMGMIGTLIGLVQMLSAMDDPKAIGPAMAVALLTTLYGAMIANMIAKPIADKLHLRKTEESRARAICVDGVLAIQEGQNPRTIESILNAYLDPKNRQAEQGGD